MSTINTIIYEDFTLENNGYGWTILSCKKNTRCALIPAYVNGLPVTKIADNAFENCTALERVIFTDLQGNSLFFDDFLEIGSYAFSGCTALLEIDIPDHASLVERGAFYGCEALERVSFSSRTYFSPYAFAKCISLKSVSPLKSISEGMFYQCKSLDKITLLSGCEEIDEDAFEHCEALSEVIIPASVRRVHGLSFRSCYALQSVIFEDTNTWYESSCYNDSVTVIDVSNPYLNARVLRSMDFDDGIIYWYKE